MTSPGTSRAALTDVVQWAVLGAPADRAGDVLAATVARETAARAVAVRLVDRAGRALHAVGGVGTTDADPVPVAGDVAAALRGAVRRDRDGTVHVPLAVRGDGQGVLSVAAPERPLDDDDWRAVGQLAALLVADAARATDFYEARRRSSSFSVSAELQWRLLPPTSLVTDTVEVHALIEPAPRVTSDLFDWSLDDDRLWLAVVDAEGRGLAAATPAASAVAALRHARRTGAALADQVALADQALYDQHRGAAVADAVVLEVDLTTSRAHAVRAGGAATAPRVLRRRAGEVEELDLEVQEALGALDRSPYRAEPVDLRRGDQVLVVTDGGPAARGGDGGTFGLGRVVDGFRGTSALGETPRRLLDALRDHSGGELAQDATALVAGWREAPAAL